MIVNPDTIAAAMQAAMDARDAAEIAVNMLEVVWDAAQNPRKIRIKSRKKEQKPLKMR